MKENRLQWLSVHKGADHHPCRSCPSLWKPFSREFRTVPIRCQEEIFCSFMFQFSIHPVLHVEHSKASAGVRFLWLCVFFVLGSTYKGLLCLPPLFSYLTIFLFGILLNLERPFEALMFKFWQQVVCRSDSQMLFPSETLQLWKQDSNAAVQELTIATITQLCHHLRNS